MAKTIAPYPGHTQFVFSTPLYSKFEISDEQVEEIFVHGVTIEGYCTKCEKDRVFKNKGDSRAALVSGLSGTKIKSEETVVFSCAFDPQHKIYVLPILDNGVIQKCGQLPSYAELLLAEDADLIKELDKKDRVEYAKAVGLAAHDAGIGAYAYLRRIFENLVYSQYEANKASNSWAEADFYKMRMSEKIQFLKNYLPPLLVQNSAAYGILSDGLHNLTEDDCLSFFPILRSGTLLILQQAREMKEQKKLEQQFTASINSKPKPKGSE
ncbi:hypothetical protein [Bradyrhizobium diazoefficiens]